MALPASDSFSLANGTPLSADWTVANGTWEHNTGAAIPKTGGFSIDAAYWDADVFGNDHYSQVVIRSGRLSGPAVRVGPAQGYVVFRSFAATEDGLYTYASGAVTLLHDFGTLLWADGDTVKLEAVGNVLSVYVNGVLADTFNDSTYPSGGAAGLVGMEGPAVTLLDDFMADDVTGPAAGQPTTKRFGGIQHTHGGSLRGGHRGGVWGRTRDGLYVPNPLTRKVA